MAKTLETLKALAAKYVGTLPDDAVPVSGKNSTLITSTTAQEIIAAPGAGKALYITKVTISNRTAAETPVIVIQDDTGTPVEILEVAMQALGDPRSVFVHEFTPPIELAANKALDGVATTATGDVTVHAQGFSGTPSASIEP